MNLNHLAITMALSACVAWPQTAPKVVFVCEHGAAKSVMAAAEFRRMAKEKGLTVDVVSRGTVPDAEIPAAIRNGLMSDGMDIGAAKPVKVSAQDLAGATKIVSFGPDLAEWLPKGSKTLDWSATPSPGKDYRAAREYIVKQLEPLVADLEKAKRGK